MEEATTIQNSDLTQNNLETPVVETPVVEEPVVETPVAETPTAPETIDINGEQIPLTELKQGYLRQSDYTKKTTDVARQREEAKDALELVQYLKDNPEIAQRLVQDSDAQPLVKSNPTVESINNPLKQELDGIKRQLLVNQIDSELSSLKSKHSDFNEVEVLNKANEMGVTDLEFVYNAMRGQNLDSIIQTKINEALANTTAQMQKDGVVSKTLIKDTDTTKVDNITLSDAEKRMADKLEMSYEDYQSWK